MSCVLSSVRTVGWLSVIRNSRVSCWSQMRPGAVRRISRDAAQFETSKFGELVIRSESICDVNVKPIDPQLFPQQNKAFVDLQGQCGGLLKVACTTTSEGNRLSLSKTDGFFNGGEQNTCHASVPIKYDIDVAVTGRRNISLSSMQNDFVRLKSQFGECTLSHIQSRSISVSTAGGHVTSEGLLQGDVTIETCGAGRVALFKPLCRQLVVKTDSGDISIGSLYAEQSSLMTHSASVNIRNAHRFVDIKITEKGNIAINSLDGDLEAVVNTGNVTVYASRHKVIRINVSQGDVTVKVPASLAACRLDLSGKLVSVDKKLLNQDDLKRQENKGMVLLTGSLSSNSEETSSISAHSGNGRVEIICQDFIESLNLEKYITYESDDD